MTTNDAPKWFWKIVATSFIGAAATLVLTGMAAGQFMGETAAWNRAQDERWNRHLDSGNNIHKDITRAIEKLEENTSSLPALEERLNSIDSRLDRLDERN